MIKNHNYLHNLIVMFTLIISLASCQKEIIGDSRISDDGILTPLPVATLGVSDDEQPTSAYTPVVYPSPYPIQQSNPTSTPSSYSSGSNLASLKQVALTKDDIPYTTDPLYSYFIDPEIPPTDQSKELKDLCAIDCVKKVWVDTNQRRAFVIVLVQVENSTQARNKVEDAQAHEIKIFGSGLKIGTIELPGLPQQSWVTASNPVKGVVGGLITLQASFGSIVMILSKQGDINVDEIPLEDYFLAIQKLALIQLDKLKSAGYTE